MHVELALTWCELARFDLAREHYRRAIEIDQSLNRRAPGGLTGAGGCPGPGSSEGATLARTAAVSGAGGRAGTGRRGRRRRGGRS